MFSDDNARCGNPRKTWGEYIILRFAVTKRAKNRAAVGKAEGKTKNVQLSKNICKKALDKTS